MYIHIISDTRPSRPARTIDRPTCNHIWNQINSLVKNSLLRFSEIVGLDLITMTCSV